MDYNNNRYMVGAENTLSLMREEYLLPQSKKYARSNIAGNKWIVEVQSGSPYYNLSFAKTHQEALAIVAGPEWSEQNDEY